MALKPKEVIGAEVHKLDQFFRVEPQPDWMGKDDGGHITQKLLHSSYSDLTERGKSTLDFPLLTIAAGAICALGVKMNSAPIIVEAI